MPTRIQMAGLGAGVAQTEGGAVRANANGTIVHASDGSNVTLFAAKTGATTVGIGTFTTDSRGRVPGWLDIADWGLEIVITVPPADPVTIVAGLTGPAGPSGTGVNFRGPYSSITTYAANDAALGSDGNWYVSFAGSNIGHDPVTDGNVHWGPVNGPNVAVIGAGSAGRTKVLVTPTGVGLRDVISAKDDTFGVASDAVTIPFTSVSGTTLNSTSAILSHQGKTICIPGAGRDDGTGIKDAWTTTVSGVSAGTSLTLANAVPTAVSTGGNRNAAIGTDDTTALSTFNTALSLGFRGKIPQGNILHTGVVDFAAALQAHDAGLGFFGEGRGAQNQTAPAGTSFWYVGPVASAGNGAGVPAMRAADTTGLDGLKMGRFSIQCLRALAVSTTVTGAGQVISPTPINLVVGSTASMPSKGRINIVGGVEAQYTSIVDGTHIGGVQTVSGSYTTVGGETVRTLTAAIYWDLVGQSRLEEVYVAGYQDNNAAFTGANQGRAAWLNNFSSGFSYVGEITGRYFKGGEETFRIGTANAGYGPRGNGGNSHFSVLTAINGSSGVRCQAEAGSPVDGCVFDVIKVIGPGVATLPDGSATYGVKVDNGWQGNHFLGLHSEGCFNHVICGGQGNGFSSAFATWQNAAAGGADGSAGYSFTSTAQGNMVGPANIGGWTGGVPGAPTGTPGFSYGAVYAAGSEGNEVKIRPENNFTVWGIALANYNGTAGNRTIDLSATTLAGDPSTGGSQQGMIVPDSRLWAAWSNMAMSNLTWLMRFVPGRSMPILHAVADVSTAAGANDNIDIGIYLWTGSTFVRVFSLGTTLSGFNTTGAKVFSFGVNLLPNSIYYAAFAYGTLGGTAPNIQGRSLNSAANAGGFGASAGTDEVGSVAGGPPLPTTLGTISWSVTPSPAIWLRET